jgi:myosin heavy subunit
MDIKERILVALGLDKSEDEIKLAFQAKGEDGTIFVSTAEELESGVDISVLTEDGTTIPLPKGTYKLDTGVTFRVEEEGVVAEVIESETEEEIEAEDKEDKKEEMAKEEEDKYEDESVAEETDWAKTYEEMKEKVENLEDAIADIKERLGEGKAEDVEMSDETEEVSDTPKTVTTKTTEVVEFSAEDEIAKLKEENEKLKTELSEQPADSPININKFSTERPALSRKEYNKLSSRDKFLYDLRK